MSQPGQGEGNIFWKEGDYSSQVSVEEGNAASDLEGVVGYYLLLGFLQ